MPNFKPSFKLQPGEKIFTIGSCFARHIELTLEALGFELVVQRLFAHPTFANSAYPLRKGALNKYTPKSILNEFQWALEPDCVPYPDPGGYLEIGPDRWLDPNITSPDAVPLELARYRRQLMLENARAVRECRVVFITPGLIEAWWDTETSSYVDKAPPIPFMKRYPDRFQLHVLSYEDVLDAFTEIHALLSRHLSPDFKILLTISPVPLVATFRDEDVMVANAYSKCVLRAAAEEFRSRHDNIGYFPSYESITLTNRDLAWQEDQVHPRAGIIDVNVCRMVEQYLEVPDATVTAKLQAALTETLSVGPEPLKALRLEVVGQKREIARLGKIEAAFDLQQEVLQAKDAQIKQAQDTATRYLRQILERDGLVTPPQEAGSGGA